MRTRPGARRTARLVPAMVALAICAPDTAIAQPLLFEDRLETALAPAGDNASLIGCIALFRAFRLYAGDETEVGQTAALRENDLAVFATLVWQTEQNLGMDEAVLAILPLIETATELYLDRFVDNYETTGRVFDDNLDQRLAFCGILRDRLMESMQ